MSSTFVTLLVISILLVGPEGPAIFSLLEFEKKGINGLVRRLVLALTTVVIATVMSLALALFGSTALEHMGIALGAIGILGGFVSVQTGLGSFRIDLLKPFRAREEGNRNKISEVANEKTEPRSWLRRLGNDLTKIFVPIVFPTSVGPAYIAWLVNPTAAGRPVHPQVATMIVVILCTMLVTLAAMVMSLSIGEKIPEWLKAVLVKLGGIVFVLFGIGTFFAGLNTLM